MAPTVRRMFSSLFADETNAASNCDDYRRKASGRYRSSRATRRVGTWPKRRAAEGWPPSGTHRHRPDGGCIRCAFRSHVPEPTIPLLFVNYCQSKLPAAAARTMPRRGRRRAQSVRRAGPTQTTRSLPRAALRGPEVPCEGRRSAVRALYPRGGAPRLGYSRPLARAGRAPGQNETEGRKVGKRQSHADPVRCPPARPRRFVWHVPARAARATRKRRVST
jgi:hypothetical protein